MPERRTEFKKIFPRNAIFPAVAKAVCNLPLGPQCLGRLVFEDLLSF